MTDLNNKTLVPVEGEKYLLVGAEIVKTIDRVTESFDTVIDELQNRIDAIHARQEEITQENAGANKPVSKPSYKPTPPPKFPTVTECCKQNPAHAKLIRAVVKQLGGMNEYTQQMMKDILSYGIDGGFHGFIYYSDTCKFAVKYQKHIVALLEEQTEQLGENVVAMVKNFNSFNQYIAGLRCNTMDKEDEKDLYLFLAGHAGRCSGHAVTNVLAWFACEEVCRMFLPEY